MSTETAMIHLMTAPVRLTFAYSPPTISSVSLSRVNNIEAGTVMACAGTYAAYVVTKSKYYLKYRYKTTSSRTWSNYATITPMLSGSNFSFNANIGNFDINSSFNFEIVASDYSGAPDYPCGIQQTGSVGTITGITGAVDMDVAFKCDTTTDITLSPGQAYQFKVTSPQIPTAVIGTQGVASLLPRYRSGNDSFFYLVGFGKPGSAAGIYVNGVKQFVVHVK